MQVGKCNNRVLDGWLVPCRLRKEDGPQIWLRVDGNEVGGLLKEELEGSVFFFCPKAGN